MQFEARGYFRYVHVMMVIVAVILPLENLATILLSGGVTIARFPPVICFARNSDMTYYSFVMVISIVMATGVSMIAIIFWILFTTVGSQQRKLAVR